MQDPLDVTGTISILNIGTRILLKDVMDQYIRTLGDFRTHYAHNMTSALRVFSENTIHIVITEVSLDDGSAYRLLKSLGGAASELDDLFVILAIEEKSDALLALAAELEVHSVLVRPFAAADLKVQIEKYRSWKELPKDPWQLLIHEARLALRERRIRDAEVFYKDALQAAPNNPAPFYKAGAYFLEKSDFGIAEGLLKKALALKPDFVQAISTLGSLYIQRGEFEKAEECLRQAIKLSPLNPDRMIEMVKLNLERSIEICKSALRLDESAHQARQYLGKFLTLKKDWLGAIREFERVLPELKDAQRAEAQTYMALVRKLGGLSK